VSIIPSDSQITFDISEIPTVDVNDKNSMNSINDDEMNVNVNGTSEVKNNTSFTIHDGVVFVTKTLWSKDSPAIKAMVCLVNASYNRKVNYSYDFVIFTTLPWSEEEVKSLQAVAAPAKLTVVLEGLSLEERMAALSPEQQEFLNKRCDVAENSTITWFHHCAEQGKVNANLGYSWQAEFRAYHIWTHPALMDYKYMMWFDSDAQVSREWDKDPVDAMVKKNLTLMYTAFPYGSISPKNHIYNDLLDKINKTYGKPICGVFEVNGSLKPGYCKEGEGKSIAQVAGYWHLTNLEIYRKDIHQKYLKLHIGTYPFSRDRDDQIAVTIPAIYESIENPNATMDARYNGFYLKIRHHNKYDNKVSTPRNRFKYYKDLEKDWPEGYNMCRDYLA